MTTNKPGNVDPKGGFGGEKSHGKALHADDLKGVTGGFVPNEVPVKIPEVQTIKVKLRDSDLTSDPEKN